METLFTARLLVDGIAASARRDASLLVRDGLIVATGEEARAKADRGALRVDLSPLVIAPGLIDCHVHLALDGSQRALYATMHDGDPRAALRAAGNMQQALQSGVTTVRDCGGRAEVTLPVARAAREGLVAGPRVVASGAPVTTTGGHCWMFGGEADGVDGVRTAVRRQCREGADFIKVMVTGGGSTPGTNFLLSQYSQAELDAIVEEAHRLGRKVTGHAHGTHGIRRAVKAGFDCIEHCSMIRESWTDAAYEHDLGREMADRGIAVCRTMTGGEVAPLEELNERHALWPQFEVLRGLARDGVTIVTGTDAGIDGTGFDLAARAVESLVGLAVAAPREALAAATTKAAQVLGIAGETGSLAPGRQADFVALATDPLQDIRALRDIRAVYRAGVEVPRPGRQADALAERIR